MNTRCLFVLLAASIAVACALGALSPLPDRASPAQTASAHVVIYWGYAYAAVDPINNPLQLAPVLEFTDRSDASAFALEQYFKGPAPEAVAAGFFADIDTSGASDGKIFALTIDRGTATVDIVRPVTFLSDLSQSRFLTSVTWLLTQFKGIDTVAVLNNGQPLVPSH